MVETRGLTTYAPLFIASFIFYHHSITSTKSLLLALCLVKKILIIVGLKVIVCERKQINMATLGISLWMHHIRLMRMATRLVQKNCLIKVKKQVLKWKQLIRRLR